ncbi:tetratricopeptide repeat protein [Dactylosporangium sp. NPDC000244]|uniref:tetratricopeptide repeat protein n=1 Tax=Dactylosporangium sp. NPDC000244 TaxID=3154365 RepID=UPI00331D933A
MGAVVIMGGATTPPRLAQIIVSALKELSSYNGHHEFEHLCRELTRRRIASNVLPATGPVSAGGDQGRDFESFRTFLRDELPNSSAFVALASSNAIVCACTLQRHGLAAKIREDVEKICSAGGRVDHIVAFTADSLPVGIRHDLQEMARTTYNVELDIWDCHAIASNLADPDLHWIAEEYLRLPASLLLESSSDHAQERKGLLRAAYDPEPARPTDLQLLAPKFGIVPFVDRGGILEDLCGWSRGTDPLAVAVVIGHAGSGKTRLAAEVCRQLESAGWDAGWATDLTKVAAQHIRRPTLLALDYGDQTDGDSIAALLARLADRPDGAQVRILLTARHCGRWWEWLRPAIAGYCRGGEAYVVDLGDKPLSANERSEHAHAAARAFAKRLGKTTPAQVDLVAEDFDSPLLIHMAVLLAVHGERMTSAPGGQRRRLLNALLGRERRRWNERLAAHRLDGSDGLHPDHVQRLVLLGTLAQPTPADGLDLLEALPELAGPARMHQRDKAMRWLHDLFPGEHCGLTPDLLAGHLMREATEGTNDGDLQQVATAVLAHPAFPQHRAAELLNAVRLAAEEHAGPRKVLRDVLATYLSPLTQLAVNNRDAALAGSLNAALILCEVHGMAGAELVGVAGEALQHVREFSPLSNALAATMNQLYLNGLRRLIDDPGRDAEQRDLFRGVAAHMLCNLGSLLMEADRATEALPYLQEAVEIRRQLGHLNEDANRADLASLLVDLGTALAATERDDAALDAVREAVETFRSLSADGSEDHLRGLAASLTNLSGQLTHLGQAAAALPAAEESVDVIEVVVQISATPRRHQRDVAAGQFNLALCLDALGRGEEALPRAANALAVYRDLATGDPEQYLPYVATALSRYGQLLTQAGAQEQAIQLTQEALAIRRKLTEGDQARHLPRLGDELLDAHSALLADGNHREALQHVEEAVDIYRNLSAAEPVRYLHDFGVALVGLATCWAAIERSDRAVAPAREAVAVHRRVCAADPGRHEGALATALTNFAAICSQAGRALQGIQAAEEAADIIRTLASRDPATHEPALATLLINLCGHWLQLGQPQAGMSAATEAVETCRRLAAVAPRRHLADLAAALGNLGRAQTQLGNRAAALSSLQESVQIYRALATDGADHHRLSLAISLRNMATALSGAGEHEAALAAARETVVIYRHFVDRDSGLRLSDLAESLAEVGHLALHAGQPGEALGEVAEAVAANRRLAAIDPEAHLPHLARCLRHQGELHALLGQRTSALAAAIEVVDTLRKIRKPDTNDRWRLADALETLAARLTDDGEPEAAAARQREAILEYTTIVPADAPPESRRLLADALDRYAHILRGLGRSSPAELAGRLAAQHRAAIEQELTPGQSQA